ncbi:MAG: serine hydrolase [Candidatus Aminicenantes bacterium]|nr:serine hydrolase [Candidatus Aminicenantes bacterium]
MKRHKFYFICLIGLSLLVSSCSKKADLGETLETEIPKLMEAADIPGMSVAVIREGAIFWSGVFGVRSRKTNEPVVENTVFEAASLTKTITAAAALKLVERGELELDLPLAEYLPYPKLAGDERYKKITARHVLTHTTGLPNWGTKLLREPGERYGYSGEGFLYLGHVVEEISGMPLKGFAKNEIFDPLGMTRTSYIWQDRFSGNIAIGHDRHGFAGQLRQQSEENGGASLLTTARDYAAFLCAILNDLVLKPETIDMMLTPQVKATKMGEEDGPDEHISWGFGWGIQPGETENGFFHWGDNGILRAYTVAYKGRKEGLCMFANSENFFTVADSLVALILKDHQYALDWLEYKRLDDPERSAFMNVEKAFLEKGKEAGLAALEEMKDQNPGLLKTEEITEMAQYLAQQDKVAEAEGILLGVLDAKPDSGAAWASLGMLYLDMSRYEDAYERFQKAMELDADNPYANVAMPWVKELIEAEKKSVTVPAEMLEKYAGDYGPRHIRLREGRLYYQRDEGKEYELIPLSEYTFSLKEKGTFRIRFMMDDNGNTVKVLGLYLGGRMDESLRNQ